MFSGVLRIASLTYQMPNDTLHLTPSIPGHVNFQFHHAGSLQCTLIQKGNVM